MSPEVLRRAFDPFFTTRKVGGGTGLGLSVCHTLVTMMGGTIEAQSAQAGTTMRVSLPVARCEPLSPKVIEALPPTSRAKVLLVDDERLVTRAVRRAISPPHEVELASGGEAALQCISAAGGRYDVILCDLMMPDLSGMQLYEEIARRHSGLEERIVFVSGGAITEAARVFLASVRNRRLDKPVDAARLLAVVAQVAAESARAVVTRLRALDSSSQKAKTGSDLPEAFCRGND